MNSEEPPTGLAVPGGPNTTTLSWSDPGPAPVLAPRVPSAGAVGSSECKQQMGATSLGDEAPAGCARHHGHTRDAGGQCPHTRFPTKACGFSFSVTGV